VTRGETLSIPALVSGGIFLTYRCTNECRHCLYNSSPGQPDEWMSLETAGRVFATLAEEPRLGPVHLSGGEPGLRLDLVEEVVRLARSFGIRVGYIQTNASWCESPSEARRLLTRLKRAGLEGLYVSVSPFHNEFVPFRRSRNCVEAAREVFGQERVTLWSPGDVDWYGVLSRMPDDGRHSLEEHVEWAAGAGFGAVLPTAVADMIPRGRLVETVDSLFERRPAGAFRGEDCMTELTTTESSATIFHYHMDYLGNLVMGCCAGLSPATVEDLHPAITAGTHPVFHRLCKEGPAGLMDRASREFGFEERETGYASKCDLCVDVRRRLFGLGRFPELRPAAFYEVD
jgi:hypothetical protein